MKIRTFVFKLLLKRVSWAYIKKYRVASLLTRPHIKTIHLKIKPNKNVTLCANIVTVQ